MKRLFPGKWIILIPALALTAEAALSFRGISEGLTESHVRSVGLVLITGTLALAVCLPGIFKGNQPAVRLGWPDAMVLLWVTWRFFAARMTGHPVPVAIGVPCVADVSLYLSLRLLFALAPKCRRVEKATGLSLVESVLVLLLSAYAFKEGILGLLQLFGRAASHHSRFSLTGSFLNPGPYGAWLMFAAAVCGSYAWRFENRFETACRHLRKTWPFVLYYACVSLATLLSLVLLPASLSRAAWVGLIVAVAIFLLKEFRLSGSMATAFRRHTGRTVWLSALCCLTGLALLAGAYVVKKPSADGRMFINRISCRIIGENPWWGCGPGRYAGAYGAAQESFFERRAARFSDGFPKTVGTLAALPAGRVAGCPSSAFNEYMQAASESGLPCLFLSMAVLGLGLTALLRGGPRSGKPSLPSPFAYGLSALVVFAAFSYPFGLLPFRLWTVVMLALAASRGTVFSDRARVTGRSWMLPLCLMVSLAIAWKGLPALRQRLQAEQSWQAMRSWYSAECFDEVVEGYAPLSGLLSDHPRFLFEYGRSLCMMERYEEALDVLQLGITFSSDPMFLNVAGNCCKELAVRSENPAGRQLWENDAELWYCRAFVRLPNRLYPLYLLEKCYYETGRRDEFEALKPRYLDFVPKIDSPEIRRMKSEIQNLPSIKDGLGNNVPDGLEK